MSTTPWQGDELNQRQFDVLWDSLQDNSLLPYSTIGFLNKQLNTDNKSIIKAINELLAKLKINDTTVYNFNENFNQLVGNPETETEDWENLMKIDRNVIRSIYKIYTEIVGTNPVDISDIGDSVKGAIRELSDVIASLTGRIEILEEKLDDIEAREQVYPDPNNPNILSISYIPNERPIILELNGIDYEENDAFTADRQNKKITWTFDLSSGGFDIALDFNVKVHYFYEPEQLTIQ
jgi:hypothetical protein